MSPVDYNIELDYGDDERQDDHQIPSNSDIERWVVDGMRKDGLSPAAGVIVTRQ